MASSRRSLLAGTKAAISRKAARPDAHSGPSFLPFSAIPPRAVADNREYQGPLPQCTDGYAPPPPSASPTPPSSFAVSQLRRTCTETRRSLGVAGPTRGKGRLDATFFLREQGRTGRAAGSTDRRRYFDSQCQRARAPKASAATHPNADGAEPTNEPFGKGCRKRRKYWGIAQQTAFSRSHHRPVMACDYRPPR